MSAFDSNTTTYALIGLCGVGILYCAFSQPKHNNFIYDPKILFTNEMRQGKDNEGAKRYWQNRFLDPTYAKGESIHYSPAVINSDKAWHNRYQKY